MIKIPIPKIPTAEVELALAGIGDICDDLQAAAGRRLELFRQLAEIGRAERDHLAARDLGELRTFLRDLAWLTAVTAKRAGGQAGISREFEARLMAWLAELRESMCVATSTANERN